MRTNAIPSMMDILSKNYNNRNGAVSLYEIGNEYIPVDGELLPDEVPNLVLVCTVRIKISSHSKVL